jgi:hypothetical protein
MAYAPGYSYQGQPTSRPFIGNAWEGFGFLAPVTDALVGAVGSYYAVKSQKEELRSRALDAEFAAGVANINARAAEQDAQAELEAGRDEQARVTAQYGQTRADAIAAAAARGVEGASVQEQLASIELAKQTDSLTITRNSVRAANRRRAEAVNERNAGLLGRVSARNIRGSASSLNPALAAGSSLLAGASGIASQWTPRYRSRY